MVFTALLIAVGGLVALGVISKHLGAGAGLAEFGSGLQQLISRPLSPQIQPRFEVQIGPNIGGLIKWLQDSWSTITAGQGPSPWTPPIIPKIPSVITTLPLQIPGSGVRVPSRIITDHVARAY